MMLLDPTINLRGADISLQVSKSALQIKPCIWCQTSAFLTLCVAKVVLSPTSSESPFLVTRSQPTGTTLRTEISMPCSRLVNLEAQIEKDSLVIRLGSQRFVLSLGLRMKDIKDHIWLVVWKCLEPWNFMTFHSVGNGIIIPTDFHSIIFQRGRYTTNQIWLFPKNGVAFSTIGVLHQMMHFGWCHLTLEGLGVHIAIYHMISLPLYISRIILKIPEV